MPECWQLAEVPEDGYLEGDVPAEVWAQISEFDAIYTRVVKTLEDAWRSGDQGMLHYALAEMMNKMPPLARSIMSTRIGNSPLHYAPSFRFQPKG